MAIRSCYTHCAPLEREHQRHRCSIDIPLLWSEIGCDDGVKLGFTSVQPNLRAIHLSSRWLWVGQDARPAGVVRFDMLVAPLESEACSICYTHCAPLEREHQRHRCSIDIPLLWSEIGCGDGVGFHGYLQPNLYAAHAQSPINREEWLGYAYPSRAGAGYGIRSPDKIGAQSNMPITKIRR